MVSINSLKRGIGSPTGTISVWSKRIISNDPSSSDNIEYIPAGYLKCDGSVLKEEEYPFLASILGVGSSSKYKKENTELGDDEFQLPDLGSKKIVASASISGNRYVNLYTQSGDARVGIGQQLVNTLEGEYNLSFSGRFQFPNQTYQFFGSPRVVKDDGVFVESGEVLENQILPHGHYHSGMRSRVENQNGDTTSSFQRNYRRLRSNVELEEWQDNTYQSACDFAFYNKNFMGVTYPSTNQCQQFHLASLFTRTVTQRCLEETNGVYQSLPDGPPLDKGWCIVTQETVTARGKYPYTPKYNYSFHIDPGGPDINFVEDKDYFSSNPSRFSSFLGGRFSDRTVRFRLTGTTECHISDCAYRSNYRNIQTNLLSINAVSSSSSYGGLETISSAPDPNEDLVTRTHSSHRRSYNITGIYYTQNIAGQDRVCSRISGVIAGRGPYRAEYNYRSSVSGCSGSGVGDYTMYTDGTDIPIDAVRSPPCFFSNSSCIGLTATINAPERATGSLTIIDLIAIPRITINGVGDIDVGDNLSLSLSFSGGAHFGTHTAIWSVSGSAGTFSSSNTSGTTSGSSTTFTATRASSRVRISVTITFIAEDSLVGIPNETRTIYSSYFSISGDDDNGGGGNDDDDDDDPDLPPGFVEGGIVDPPTSPPRIDTSGIRRRELNLYNFSTSSPDLAPHLPYDTDFPSDGSYTSVRNVTVESDLVSRSTVHRHLIPSDVRDNTFELQLNANTIDATPLEGICNIRSISADHLNQFVQPFIVQEYIIKF